MSSYIPTEEDIDLHIDYMKVQDEVAQAKPEYRCLIVDGIVYDIRDEVDPKRLPRMSIKDRSGNFSEMNEICKNWLKEKTKSGDYWYIVFNPYNKEYDKLEKLYQSGGFDFIRKNFMSKDQDYFITREISNCAKTHWNVFIIEKREKDWMLLHNTGKTKKFNLWVQCDVNPENTLNYMIKESKYRPFKKYVDYYFT